MNKYAKSFTNMIAAQTLAEAKNVSKYLRKNTSLSIDARNKLAESYFKKSLKEKFSQLYSEAAAPGIFETFMTTIGAWANELFGALGTVLKVIVSGMMKLYDFFFGAGGALNLGSGSTGPGVLSRVIGKIGGMDITGGQALFMAAIFGLMIWGIYKVCSWLRRKSQFSESYIPMFSEDDESFLRRLTTKAKEKMGALGSKISNSAPIKGIKSGFGMLSAGANKLARMCVEKGAKAYNQAKKYAYDPVIAKISPKYAQFMDIVGPKFAAMKKTVMTKVDSAGEWIQGYNPMKLRAKLADVSATAKELGNQVSGLTDRLGKATSDYLGDISGKNDEIAKLRGQLDSTRKRAKLLGQDRRSKIGYRAKKAVKRAGRAPAPSTSIDS